MSIPDVPSVFKQPTAAERPWWWQLVDASGAEVAVDDGELAGQRFANQSDAESWVGETWHELADQGVAQVTLFEADREVYGPMSLSA